MLCPKCGKSSQRKGRSVLQTSESPAKTTTRMRMCPICCHRWWTIEVNIPVDGLIEYPVGHGHRGILAPFACRRITAALPTLFPEKTKPGIP